MSATFHNPDGSTVELADGQILSEGFMFPSASIKELAMSLMQDNVDAAVLAERERCAKIAESCTSAREHELFRGLSHATDDDGWRTLTATEKQLLACIAAKIREGK